MKHTDATGSRASLNICLTYTKKESWSAPWRYPNTWIIIGVIGAVWSIHRSRLEQVGGCRWTTLEITASTTRLPFIHVRSVGNQTAYSEDDHVNSVASRASSGWEEPKRTKRNCNAIIRKTHENQWKPWKVMGCPVSGGFVGLTTVVYPVHIDELWVRCVRARPCQNYWASMLVEWGLQST